MDKKFKLIAFDIDGTVLPFEDGRKNKSLDPVIVRMLEKLKKAGYITCFCTGRDIFTIGDKIDTPYVDYFIGANGAFIIDLETREYIFEKTISYHDYEVFLNATNLLQLPFSFVGKTKGFYNKLFDINHWFYEPFKENFYDISNYNEHSKENNYLITVISEESAQMKKYYTDLFESNNLDLWVLAEWTGGLFISAKGINKARGLEILCQKLDISLDDVIAFGDSSNDVEMLEEVGLGVAMGNADYKLKSVAKESCDTVENYGTFKFLKRRGII